MSISPRYTPTDPEQLIIGMRQHDAKARTRFLLFVITPIGYAVLALCYYIVVVADLFLWYYVPLLLFIAFVAGYFIYQNKKGARWIEGGDYAEYCKGETVRIYYKDIMSWSANKTTTTITDGAQSIVIKDGLAFPHLFRYLADKGIPAEASSPVQDRAYLEERYQKSRERAVSFLNAAAAAAARKRK